MEKIIAILAVFGSPVAIVWAVMYFRYRGKQLQLEGANKPERALLAASEAERRKLEARVQNLETIVCSVDFELNQRLNRLAADASRRLPALPPGPTPAGVTGPPGALPEALGATVASTPPPGPDGHPAIGQLEIGRLVLGRYRIVRELGHGGMGAVYLADDQKLGENVALKVISSVMAGDPAQAVARFHREVQAARRVTHPNVVRIHDLGEEGALLFLSMEYVDGETLAARIRRRGALPPGEAVPILCDVAAGVAAAHEAGVVHRDLKPQNVLLGGGASARAVKVIDFGLATSSFFAGMTATGMIMGTPEYMAPEQIRGGACDARTDVYALGAVAYHVLCGRPPFLGETPIAVGFAHLTDPPRPPRELAPAITPELETAILRALSKDPVERFATPPPSARRSRREAQAVLRKSRMKSTRAWMLSRPTAL